MKPKGKKRKVHKDAIVLMFPETLGDFYKQHQDLAKAFSAYALKDNMKLISSHNPHKGSLGLGMGLLHETEGN